MSTGSEGAGDSSPEATILGVEADEARVAVYRARTRHLSLVFGQIAAVTAATLGLLAGVDPLGASAVGLAFLIGLEFARRRAKRDLDHIRSVSEALDRAVEALELPHETDPAS